MRRALLALSAIAVLPAAAQPLQVYSDLAQIDARGRVAAPEFPREILSPALVRNGFTSFQIVVQVPDDKAWELYVAQNPDDAVDVTLYRISGEKLEPVQQGVRGTGTQVFWMDLWTEANDTVARIKVEPQLHLGEDWVIYPMEARVMTARVPMGQSASYPELCGAASGPRPAGSPLGQTIPALRYRNQAQDRALAAGVPPDDLRKALAGCPEDKNPELYLRIRDFLFRRQGGA